MTGAGDLYLYQPGEAAPVEVVADANGDVALRGEGVAITGENQTHTEVALPASAGEGVGFLARDPEDYTGSQGDYSAGDSAGVCELELWSPVARLTPADDWDPATAGSDAAVGDLVEWAAGGVIQLYNSADAPAPYGRVFSTRGWTVAVALW